MAPLTTTADIVDRALLRRKEARFAGSVWRLGRVALTTTDGQLTDAGHLFRARRPEADLSHYKRSTERITGKQVRVQDLLGKERIVATVADGEVTATKTGQAYYGTGSSVFQALAPAWRKDSQGQLYRTTASLDDQWIRSAPGGDRTLAELRSMVYTTDPTEVH